MGATGGQILKERIEDALRQLLASIHRDLFQQTVDLGVAVSLCQPPGIATQIDAERRHKRGNDLVVPHILEQFCDRLVALKSGQLVADGSPRDIMDSGILESIYGVPMGVMERAPGQWVSYAH